MYQLISFLNTRESILHLQKVSDILSGEKVQHSVVSSQKELRWILSRSRFDFLYVVAHTSENRETLLGNSFLPLTDLVEMLSMGDVPETIFFNTCFGNLPIVWSPLFQAGLKNLITSSVILPTSHVYQYAELFFLSMSNTNNIQTAVLAVQDTYPQLDITCRQW